jgi:hypothetical protein
MRGCDHNKIFSGRTNLEQKFEWICSRCGEVGWDETYLYVQVSADEFYTQRVAHGWASPRLPAPPSLPTRTLPIEPSAWPWVPGVLFFTLLSAACALAAIPWGVLGPIMPLWMAMIGSGIALATATVCYVAWKKGL